MAIVAPGGGRPDGWSHRGWRGFAEALRRRQFIYRIVNTEPGGGESVPPRGCPPPRTGPLSPGQPTRACPGGGTNLPHLFLPDVASRCLSSRRGPVGRRSPPSAAGVHAPPCSPGSRPDRSRSDGRRRAGTCHRRGRPVPSVSRSHPQGRGGSPRSSGGCRAKSPQSDGASLNWSIIMPPTPVRFVGDGNDRWSRRVAPRHGPSTRTEPTPWRDRDSSDDALHGCPDHPVPDWLTTGTHLPIGPLSRPSIATRAMGRRPPSPAHQHRCRLTVSSPC